LSGRVTPSVGDSMANVITSPTQLLGSFFIILTESGESAIAFSELAAITKRKVGRSLRFDIHLKSGTIFTAPEIPIELMRAWFNAD
jgi:hypothetical protein